MKKFYFLLFNLIACLNYAQNNFQTVVIGDTIVLNVIGANGTVQWQNSVDSIIWTDIPNLTNSTDTIIAVASATNFMYYRAKVINPLICANSEWYSDIIKHRVITDFDQLLLGDRFGGGIVFYQETEGNGLISSLFDQNNNLEWGCMGTNIENATSTLYGDSNTTAIIQQCLTRPIAASVCDDLDLNGQTDWFLPAQNQVIEMYNQRTIIDGLNNYNGNWTSTEFSADKALRVRFIDGLSYATYKNFSYRTRCIRKYNPTNYIKKISSTTSVTNEPVSVGIEMQPSSIIKCTGSMAAFYVSASGDLPYSFQWKKDGIDIIGENDSILIINNISSLDEGIYTCDVGNFCNTIESQGATLSVSSISILSSHDMVLLHDTVVLNATTYTGEIQWQSSADSINWTDITGATQNNYPVCIENISDIQIYFRAKITDTLCPNSSVFYSSLIRLVIYPDKSYINVGDPIYGGIVFQINTIGEGLVSKISDEIPVTSKWGCYNVSITGSESFSDGQNNTSAILAACSESTIAAELCNNEVFNGYEDWFLPAVDQLTNLYETRDIVGGFSSNDYWSSTQSSATSAYFKDFGDGLLYSTGKNSNKLVRCTRAFSSDNNNVILTAEADIMNQPEPVVQLSDIEKYIICEGNDTLINYAYTGTQPFIYTWKKDNIEIPGATDSTLQINNLSLSDQGVYTCIVENICNSVASIGTELKVIKLITNAGEDVLKCPDDSRILTATALSNHPEESINYNFLWTPSTGLSETYNDSVTASPVNTMNYSVIITDNNNCTATDMIQVWVQNVFQNEEICLVTVDGTSGKNKITWNKTPDAGTGQYTIYKQQGSGNYEILGMKLFSDPAEIIDNNSNPSSQVDHYKIALSDTCGNISEQSPYHKTLLLSINQGAQTTDVNLIWTPYEIEGSNYVPYYYYIYRGDDIMNLMLFDSVAGTDNMKVYSDVTDLYYYKISFEKNCDNTNLYSS